MPKLAQKTSQYIGVSYSSATKAWVAQLKSQGRSFYLGLFDVENDAACAYDDGKRTFFEQGLIDNYDGRLNFPERANAYFHLSSKKAKYKSPSYIKKPNNDLFKCRGITYYQARNIWKLSFNVDKKKLYIGAFKTHEEAVRAGVDYLNKHETSFSNILWLNRTLDEFENVLGLYNLMNEPLTPSPEPLLFSPKPSVPRFEKNLFLGEDIFEDLCLDNLFAEEEGESSSLSSFKI